MRKQEINNLIKANTKLAEELRLLKQENKSLTKKINNAIDLIELNICGGSISNARELLDILKEVI